MSAHNTPSQRPVQHNPYATTPPLGPRPAPTVSPPAQGLPPSENPSAYYLPQQQQQQAAGVVGGTRFSHNHHQQQQQQQQQYNDGNSNSNNTPKSTIPAFMGGHGYSMYVATPQHNAQSGSTIPARMSPGPALGPSAATLASPDTPNGRSGSVHSSDPAPPSYESLIGRVSPQASSTNPNAGNSGMGQSNHNSGGNNNNNSNSTSGHQSVFGGWSVAAQHTTPSSGSTFSSHNFHSYPMPSDDKLGSHGGRGFGGGLGGLHDHESRHAPPLRFAAGGHEESSLPLLMQGVPRLTPYTQPSYANQNSGNTGGGSGLGGGMGGHGGNQQQHQHHGQHQSSSIPQSLSSNSAGSNGPNGGPRPGASAHVFLMHKLRYIPLSQEYFIQQPRHQSQPMLGGGGGNNGGNPMMGHPMMQPDRPIQMFNGRGRPLQDFCPTADLFVAQLPFNMELTALQYLFDMVSQVPADIIHAAPHYKRGRSYDGCAFVKVSQNVAAILVDTFHKAALFDEEGVWVADTQEQRSILANYCGFMQQKSPQERRALLRKPIPFSAMTVEFANRSYAF